MQFWRRLVLAFLALAPTVQAQTPEPSFPQALQAASMPLILANGKLSGAGAEALETAVRQSRFVLLGEDHFTREIPLFAAALCNMVHPDAYAVEAGPEAARFVSALLRRPDRIARMSKRLQAYPGSMAFLDMRPENDLAAHCAASSRNPGFALWGLDQEFLGSAGALLEAMAETKPGPRARSAIAAAQVQERAAAVRAKQAGRYDQLFLVASSDGEIDALQSAVDADGTAATRDLLHEFVVSRRIYRLHLEHSPESNLVRAELLKLHFLQEYLPLKQANPAARVFFKFGDNHTGKGFSYTHELNLGDFVAELAAGEQAQSLHIFVLGAHGAHATMVGYGRPIVQEPFVLAQDPDSKWLAPAVADLLPQQPGAPGTTLTLFDLRKLRYRGLNLSREWEHAVYSYDICILIPELTPTSAIE